jgi:type VI secretion system protein ImpA
VTTELPEAGLKDVLLKPFDGDLPAGEDLRLDISPQSIYFRLRDARAEARAAERLADNDPTLGGALPVQWNTVHDLAVEALASRSKDVEIACWLTECLTRRQGLAGLADGVEIVVGLITHFWDAGLFPSVEEEDAEGRLIAVTGMSGQDRDGSLLQPLRKTLLFTRPDGTPVTLWEFERAKEFAALGPRPEKAPRPTASVLPFSDLEVEARGPGKPSLLTLGRDILRAEAVWRLLEETVARVAPKDAVPATGRVRSLLDSLRRLVERYIPSDELAPPEPGTDAAADTVAASDAGEATPEPPKHDASLPESREAMLDEIIRIAAAFRQNEPNSPLSFTLEEAVRRARLPWPDLLRELMPDISARSMVLTGAGIRPPAE